LYTLYERIDWMTGEATIKADNNQGVKVSHFEGLATHIALESCVGGRKAAGEALTGESTGLVPSHEMPTNLEADHVPVLGRPHQDKRYASLSWLQRGQRSGARAEVYYAEIERSLCLPEASQLQVRFEKANHQIQTCTTRGSRTEARYLRRGRTKPVKGQRSSWRES